MIQQNRWAEYKTAVALLVACVVLLLVIIIEWSQLHSYEPAKGSGKQEANENSSWFGEVPYPVEVLQLPGEYHEITQRPLFFQGRRPLETNGDELGNFKGKLELILTGVIVTPKGLSALIKDNKNQSHHLKLGEDIDGWLLDAVYGHKIVLKKDDKRKVILLRDPSKRKKDIVQSRRQHSPIAASKQQKAPSKRKKDIVQSRQQPSPIAAPEKQKDGLKINEPK